MRTITSFNPEIKKMSILSEGMQHKKVRMHKRHHSFVFAINGVKQILKQESNFRMQFVLGIISVLSCAVLNCSATEWALVLFCCALVLTTEAINSVIEEVIDWIHPDHHEKAGKIKDMAAAAPFIASVFAVITGLLIFAPKVWKLVSTFI